MPRQLLHSLLSPVQWHGDDSSASFLTRTEQVSWNYVGINEWPMTKGISAPGVLVHISVLEESVHDVQCVVHEESVHDVQRIILLSLTSSSPCWPITYFLHRPGCVQWSLHDSLVDSLVLILHRESRIFHKSRVQCTWVWAVYVCQTHGDVSQLQSKHPF